MATNPPVPPKTAADLPAFKQGKLNTVERGLVKNAVEGAQKWMKDNEGALKARGHFYLDEAIRWAQTGGHGLVDTVIGKVRDAVNAVKV